MTVEARALLESFGVSRETFEKLAVYEDSLCRWQARMNLISASTKSDIWMRHFADSLQLIPRAPESKIWMDIGTGAGFPGLPIAIHFSSNNPSAVVHLVERDHRKCAFLREVSRVTGASAIIHNMDVAAIVQVVPRVDIVTARAVAPLRQLTHLAKSYLDNGARGLFLKGQDVDRELNEVSTNSNIRFEIRRSLTDSGGFVVVADALSAQHD